MKKIVEIMLKIGFIGVNLEVYGTLRAKNSKNTTLPGTGVFILLAHDARNACWCNTGKNVMEVTSYFLTGFLVPLHKINSILE